MSFGLGRVAAVLMAVILLFILLGVLTFSFKILFILFVLTVVGLLL